MVSELSGYIYPVQSPKAGVKALAVALSWHGSFAKWRYKNKHVKDLSSAVKQNDNIVLWSFNNICFPILWRIVCLFFGCKVFSTRYQPNEQLQQVFQEIKQYMENSKKLIILWISGFRIIRGTFTYMHVPSSVCKSWGQSPCWHSSQQSQWLYNVKIIMYFPLTHEWEDPCTL